MSNKKIIIKPNLNHPSSEKSELKMKICGMKYPDNIGEIAVLQPDYLGFIFYEKSSRFFNDKIPKLSSDIKKVGVFVNASINNIIEKIEKYSLDLVQLHGDETPEFCKELKRCIRESTRNENSKNPAFEGIIKVFSVNDDFNFDELKPYESVCDYFLFDTKGKLPGGNGYVFNWEVLKDYPSTKPYFLSGGIGLETIENITAFLQRPESHYCHAIDVNSKFEIEAGLKSVTLLKEFKNRIKADLTNFEDL